MKKHKNDEIVGKLLCRLGDVVAPTASSNCAVRFYQPKEPAGLKAFVGKKNR